MTPEQITAHLQAADPYIDAANAANAAGDYDAEARHLDDLERHLGQLHTEDPDSAASLSGVVCGIGGL